MKLHGRQVVLILVSEAAIPTKLANISKPQPSLAQVQSDATEHGSQSCPQLATVTTFKANVMLKSAVRAIGAVSLRRECARPSRRGLRKSSERQGVLKLYI